MNKKPNEMSWRQSAWMMIGVFLLILGLGCCQLNLHSAQLLLVNSDYDDAELEIVQYHLIGSTTGFGPPGDYRHTRRGTPRKQISQIEGIIHPGNIPIITNDHDIQLAYFDKSANIVVDMPLPQEVVGKRIPVLYWSKDPAQRQWYHPPVVLTAVRPSPTSTILSILLCFGMLYGAISCFRYGYNRRLAVKHRAEERQQKWPPWTFFVLCWCVLTYPLLALVAMASTTGFTRSSTARIPWTTTDWVMHSVFIAIIAIVPCLFTIALGVAVRRRLAYRATNPSPQTDQST